MIRLLKHNEIDKARWDETVSGCADAPVFLYSWYLDIVCPGWIAFVEEDYKTIFPIATRSRFGIRIIFQPFFTRYFGAYGATNAVEDAGRFLELIPKHFRQVEIRLHEHNTSNNFGTSDRRQYQKIELNKSADELFAGFSENVRRNIKKARKAGLVVNTGVSAEEIVNLFKSTKGDELSGFTEKSFLTLLSLMNACNEHGGEMLGVFYDGRLIAAASFMRKGNVFTYLKSGVTEEGRKLGAMHFLFDEFIARHAAMPAILDFGGSNVESVARFYKSFGGKDSVYLQVTKNNLPPVISWLKANKK